MLATLVASGDLAGVREHLHGLNKQGKNVQREVQSCEFGGRGSRPALHVATIRGHTDILEHLLATKADPNTPDEAGTTPLHFAAELGCARAACMLLLAGADANCRNAFGSTPADKVVTNTWDSSLIARGKADIKKMFEGKDEMFEGKDLQSDDVPLESPIRNLPNTTTTMWGGA